jgi:hypothetical protein
MWKTMQVICGAIERVDYPAVLVLTFDYPRLFSQDRMAWKCFQQFLDDSCFCFPVDFTDVVIKGFSSTFKSGSLLILRTIKSPAL